LLLFDSYYCKNSLIKDLSSGPDRISPQVPVRTRNVGSGISTPMTRDSSRKLHKLHILRQAIMKICYIVNMFLITITRRRSHYIGGPPLINIFPSNLKTSQDVQGTLGTLTYSCRLETFETCQNFPPQLTKFPEISQS
jgi:hypothetical protein